VCKLLKVKHPVSSVLPGLPRGTSSSGYYSILSSEKTGAKGNKYSDGFTQILRGDIFLLICDHKLKKQKPEAYYTNRKYSFKFS
jgi:hypothetical protein